MKRLVIKNLCVSTKDGMEILNGLDLTVNEHEKVAVLGQMVTVNQLY